MPADRPVPHRLQRIVRLRGGHETALMQFLRTLGVGPSLANASSRALARRVVFAGDDLHRGLGQATGSTTR